jgi:hypothetical protein
MNMEMKQNNVAMDSERNQNNAEMDGDRGDHCCLWFKMRRLSAQIQMKSNSKKGGINGDKTKNLKIGRNLPRERKKTDEMGYGWQRGGAHRGRGEGQKIP